MKIRDARINFSCDICVREVLDRPKAVEVKDKTLIVCGYCYNQMKGGQDD